MEILKKPYKKTIKPRKYASARWPHERAKMACKQAIEKKSNFDQKEYHKKRYAEMKKWKQGWFSHE